MLPNCTGEGESYFTFFMELLTACCEPGQPLHLVSKGGRGREQGVLGKYFPTQFVTLAVMVRARAEWDLTPVLGQGRAVTI